MIQALNQGFTYTETIAPRSAGVALEDYLGRTYTHTSTTDWKLRIQEGSVQLDGQPARPESILCAGQTLTWSRPPWHEPEAPLYFEVIYEDEDLLAVAKPSGLPTLPGAGFMENTLLGLVRKTCPDASPVHRLGRGTSGIVLFAKTPQALASLCSVLREHTMDKIYRALITGHPCEESFIIESPIGPMPHPCLGTVHAASPKGKPARSHVKVLDRRGPNSLAEIRIETGRPHQIRIHTAFAGHPLVGDPLYVTGGLPHPETQALPGDLGYLLHAFRVNPPHPRTGGRISIECAAPPELSMEGESCVHRWERTI